MASADCAAAASPRASRFPITQLTPAPLVNPRSRATYAIAVPVSRTICTAPAMNPGSNCLIVAAMNLCPSRSVPPDYEGKDTHHVSGAVVANRCATSSRRLRTEVLAKMVFRWSWTVRLVSERMRAMSLVLLPRTT